MSVWSWIVTLGGGGVTAANASPAAARAETQQVQDVTQVVSGPFSGLEGIAQVIGQIGRAITDKYMWRSLAWLLLGVLLIVMGFLWLNKGTITKVAGAAML